MKLDRVHHLQEAYREIVRCMSFPGRTCNLTSWAELIEPAPEFNPVMLLIGMMLLDGEVQFFLSSSKADSDTRLLTEFTSSRSANPGEAQFIFLTRNGENQLESLDAASTGTLMDPQLGSTVILEVERLNGNGAESEEKGRSTSLVFSGPGIPDERRVYGVWETDWVRVRNEKTAEFPLGIDMLLVDQKGEVMAIPRNTRILPGSGD